MELNPGYKQTEVGVIPATWQCASMSSIARLESGHTPSKREASYWGGSVAWVSLHDTDALDGPEIVSTAQTITEDGLKNSSARLLPKGTVVFSRTATVGKVTTLGRAMATSQDFAAYICGPELNNHFLVYLFRSMGRTWQSLMAGSIHNTIYMPAFRALKIALPPIAEQHSIAQALSDMDELLGGLDQVIAKKRDLKQAAMQQLLTGRIRLPGFHGEWVIKRLDEVADVIDPHPSHRAPDEVSNGVPFVGIGDLCESGDIAGTKLRYVDRSVLIEHASRYNLNEQLIGLGRVASIGKVVCLKVLPEGYAISPTLGIIRGRTAKRDYLLYALRSRFITDQFTRIMSGSTRSSVGMEVLRKLHILLPPSFEEQTAIAEVLTDMDAELAALEQQRSKTRALKQSMMQELLTGRTRLVSPEEAHA